MAQPNPSKSNPTAEPFIGEINSPSSLEPPTPRLTPAINPGGIEPYHQNPLPHHQPPSHLINMISSYEHPTLPYHHSPVSTSAVPVPVQPHTYHGFLGVFFEQLMSHVVRQIIPPPPPPPPPVPTTPSTPPHDSLIIDPPPGSFNFKMDPIKLHITSSSSSSSSSNPITSSSDSPKPKQQPGNDTITTPPSLPPPSSSYVKHQKALSNVGSLANLLPTGTVLAFQALTPSLSESGTCHLTNKILIFVVIISFTLICFFSSFFDSVRVDDKIYYGLASPSGLLVFNYDNPDREKLGVDKAAKDKKLRYKDFLHAFVSVAVFLIFAFSSSDVQRCMFPRESEETQYSLVVYLPLVAGILSSFLFTLFPTSRKGIGYT